MEIKLTTGDINKIKADAVIVGIFEDVEGSELEKDLDKALAGAVAELRKKKEIKGKNSELTIIHSLGKINAAKVAILGLGEGQSHAKFKFQGACPVISQQALIVIPEQAEPAETRIRVPFSCAPRQLIQGSLIQ